MSVETRKESRKRYYLKNREYLLELRKKHYQEHKEQTRETNKKWRESHKELIEKQAREYYLSHKEESRVRVNKSRYKLRIEILTYYGQGKLACAVCGEKRIPALSIDHIYNDGAAQRRKMFGRKSPDPHRFYLWLRREGYPDGYLTLCMNCQFVKESNRREGLTL